MFPLGPASLSTSRSLAGVSAGICPDGLANIALFIAHPQTLVGALIYLRSANYISVST